MDTVAPAIPPAPSPPTLAAVLARWAEAAPEAPAIVGLDRAALDFRGLRDQAETLAQALAARGLGRGDRIATVLPDGPEAASAFLALAACAAAAPLNPAYHAADFEFYLGDLRARAVLLPQGAPSPARAAAARRGVPVLELQPDPRIAGRFTLAGPPAGPARAREAPAPADVALVLHTSGTTSRPKIVPLTQANLCASAEHIGRTLALSPADRCLDVMPLFHIHGLVGGLLASIAAGASVACPPGFRAAEFLAWMERLAPTWYTAVPTMHQAILAAVAGHAEALRRRPLRLVRSSSASLPPPVMAELERVFGVPVIESYGMTEAAHQMASNPLPPGRRKPGSVGLAAGPQIAILDDAGAVLGAGQTGEIAIRGPNVTPGYENNPAANAAAFTQGWFRTGDQGRLDDEGYLFITGRLKEIINRGGEKIAPREVDEALLAHPEVRQATAFAVPHPSLGEDVAAAVVAKPGCRPDEAALREFVFGRLPAFKVPSRILLVDDIPKGPTGKVQRIGLAERLGERLATAYAPPASETEAAIAQIFADVLRQQRVGRHDNFFALGGDSLRATQVLARLHDVLHAAVPAATLFRHPTPALLAAAIPPTPTAEVEALAQALEKLPAAERQRLLDEIARDP